MKITLESEYNKSTIEVKDNHMDIYDVASSLLIPVLLAYGFQQGSIDEIFNADFTG